MDAYDYRRHRILHYNRRQYVVVHNRNTICYRAVPAKSSRFGFHFPNLSPFRIYEDYYDDTKINRSYEDSGYVVKDNTVVSLVPGFGYKRIHDENGRSSNEDYAKSFIGGLRRDEDQRIRSSKVGRNNSVVQSLINTEWSVLSIGDLNIGNLSISEEAKSKPKAERSDSIYNLSYEETDFEDVKVEKENRSKKRNLFGAIENLKRSVNAKFDEQDAKLPVLQPTRTIEEDEELDEIMFNRKTGKLFQRLIQRRIAKRIGDIYDLDSREESIESNTSTVIQENGTEETLNDAGDVTPAADYFITNEELRRSIQDVEAQSRNDFKSYISDLLTSSNDEAEEEIITDRSGNSDVEVFSIDGDLAVLNQEDVIVDDEVSAPLGANISPPELQIVSKESQVQLSALDSDIAHLDVTSSPHEEPVTEVEDEVTGLVQEERDSSRDEQMPPLPEVQYLPPSARQEEVYSISPQIVTETLTQDIPCTPIELEPQVLPEEEPVTEVEDEVTSLVQEERDSSRDEQMPPLPEVQYLPPSARQEEVDSISPQIVTETLTQDIPCTPIEPEPQVLPEEESVTVPSSMAVDEDQAKEIIAKDTESATEKKKKKKSKQKLKVEKERPLKNIRDKDLEEGFEATVYIVNANKRASSSLCVIQYNYEIDTLVFKSADNTFEIESEKLTAEEIPTLPGAPILMKIAIEGNNSSAIVIQSQNARILNVLGSTIGWAKKPETKKEVNKISKNPSLEQTKEVETTNKPLIPPNEDNERLKPAAEAVKEEEDKEQDKSQKKRPGLLSRILFKKRILKK